MIEKKPHFLWADIIRIVAIYLVLSVHLSFMPKEINRNDFLYFLHFAIAKTSIPLFVMLSGALLLGKVETYKDFFFKRIKRLVFPWMFWTIIFVVFLNQGFNLQNLKNVFQSFWFLPMIFALYILTPALRIFIRASQKRHIFIVILIWVLSVSILPYYFSSPAFPYHVDNGLVRQVVNFIGYYLLGYLLINIKLLGFRQIILSIVSILLGVFIIMFSLYVKGGITQGALYYYEYISPGILILSIGLFIFLYILSGVLAKNMNVFTSNNIKSVSSCSLGIYFSHGLIWPIIQNNFALSTFPIMSMITNIFILFLVCFILIYLLSKVPILGKVVT